MSGEKCRKDTPGKARLYDGGSALLVLDLTLTTFSVKKLAERLHVDGMTGGVCGRAKYPQYATVAVQLFIPFIDLDLAPPTVGTFVMTQLSQSHV